MAIPLENLRKMSWDKRQGPADLTVRFSGLGNIQTFTAKRKPAERGVTVSRWLPPLGCSSSRPPAVVGAATSRPDHWGKDSFSVTRTQILAPAEGHRQRTAPLRAFLSNERDK